MTLDEAIKHAEEIANNLEREAECIRSWGQEKDTKQGAINCEKCATEHRQLAEWLKELKRLREQTRWIPCSERLPEPGEYYLITRQLFGWNCTEYREIDIAKYDFDGWHNKATKVLAWCELPEPWKGEQSE